MAFVTKNTLVGKITTFELSEFGDSLPKSESAFKANISKKGKVRHDYDESTSKYVSIYDDKLR
jgi:hypothetical protein